MKFVVGHLCCCQGTSGHAIIRSHENGSDLLSGQSLGRGEWSSGRGSSLGWLQVHWRRNRALEEEGRFGRVNGTERDFLVGVEESHG